MPCSLTFRKNMLQFIAIYHGLSHFYSAAWKSWEICTELPSVGEKRPLFRWFCHGPQGDLSRSWQVWSETIWNGASPIKNEGGSRIYTETHHAWHRNPLPNQEIPSRRPFFVTSDWGISNSSKYNQHQYVEWMYIYSIYIYGIWNMNEYDIWISFWNILEYVGWIWYMLNVLQQSKTQKCLINCFIWFINQLYLSQPEKSLKISSPACVRLIASWMMYADMHTSAMAGGEDRALW